MSGHRESVREAAAAVFEQDVDPVLDLFDQGVTSLAFVRLVARLNVAYDVELDVAELDVASLDALSELVVASAHTPQGATR